MTAPILIAALAIGAAYFLWPRQPNLLDRATWIPPLNDWSPRYPYRWLSEGELLFTHPKGRRDAPTLSRYRLASGSATIDQPLTNRVREWFYYPPGEMKVSPDGQWLLFKGHTCRLDGTQPIRRKYMINGIWLPDSRCFLGNEDPQYSTDPIRTGTYSVTSSSRQRVLPRPIGEVSREGARDQAPAQSGQMPRIDFEGAIITPNGMITGPVLTQNFGDENQVEIARWKVEADTLDVQKWRISAPANLRITDVALSPRGDLIAYLVSGRPRPPLPEFLYRLFPTLSRPDHVYAIWVCHADGSAAREVGRIEDKPESDTPHGISSLQWVPGGRLLSFVHADNLYTVPVP